MLENGSKGTGIVDETWVYTEATNAWSMAFDSVAGAQVFFGGEDPDDVFFAYGNTVECW